MKGWHEVGMVDKNVWTAYWVVGRVETNHVLVILHGSIG